MAHFGSEYFLKNTYVVKHQSSNVIKILTMMKHYIIVNIKMNPHGTQYLRKRYHIIAVINLIFKTLSKMLRVSYTLNLRNILPISNNCSNQSKWLWYNEP